MSILKREDAELYLAGLQKNILSLFDISNQNSLVINNKTGGDLSSLERLASERFDNIVIWGYERAKYDLQKLLAGLNDGGSLVLFTDNRMAFKSLTGYKRIGSDMLFEDLYNDNKDLYSYKEWIDVLNSYADIRYEMYYPYPDWRYPVYLFSDEKLPQPGELNLNGLNPLEYKVQLFDNDKLMDSINREGLFPQFSNSFLIRICKER